METIDYINDPSTCLYDSFAMMAFLAHVFGLIVIECFGPSVGYIGTLDFLGRNT